MGGDPAALERFASFPEFLHTGSLLVDDVQVRFWPLQDIVITNIVWCIAYKREVRMVNPTPLPAPRSGHPTSLPVSRCLESCAIPLRAAQLSAAYHVRGILLLYR